MLLILTFALSHTLTLATRDAHAQYFGRNKVQYRSFDFQIIRTEHFDIYYYEQEREAVMDAARMTERSYARLSKILQHEFKQRKPVILYASHTDFQQTNALAGFIDESTGGVTEAYKNRIIMPFTGSYAEFDHVLNHEMVHAFQYDVIFSRGVLNESSPFSAGRLPLWFMEGMAEYLSIGRIDPHTVSWLRDAALTGYLRSVPEMSRRDDYLSYRFGQSLWAFIGQKWGDEVVGILLQKAPRMGVERAIATTLGLSVEDLSREWTAQVRKTYLPQVAQFQTPESFSKKLTDHEDLGDEWYLAPAISADGQHMALLSQHGGYSFDLWLADANTGKLRKRLISSSKDADFESLRFMNSSAAFAPDGKLLAFVAQTSGQDALYIYDIAKRKVTRKLKFALNGLASPSFSPDGKSIAFSGNDGGLSDLFITTLAGKVTRLTRDKYADLVPSWSPDGTRIAFTTDRGPDTDLQALRYGNFRVALIDVATNEISLLPGQDRGKNHNPVWSPDSKQLIWVNDVTGTNNLYIYDLAKLELARISDVLSGVIAVVPTSPVLAWSATGRLLYTYFEKAGYNIYSIDDPRTLPRYKVDSATAPLIAATPSASPSPSPDDGITRSFYRSAAGFRASSERVRTADVTPPVSVLAMIDNATTALPDTAGFELKDYKVKFTPDMIGRPTVGAQVGGYYGNGLYGGSYIALSDMLGNHQLFFAGNINGSFSDASIYTGYAFLKTRANLSVAVQQIPLYRYLGGGIIGSPEKDRGEEPVLANVFLRDVIRTAQAQLSYPFSRFRRVELGVNAANYQSDLIFRGTYPGTGESLNHNESLGGISYWEPNAAMVFDNSLFGWTGPVSGRRYRLQFSNAMGDLQFTEGLLDFRNYISYKQSLIFATRLTTLTRTGRDADRFLLYWGGPYFIRGYDAGSFELGEAECENSRHAATSSASSCPVRDQLIGSSAAFMNAELRVPIIKQLQVGFLGNFPPVDLVAFFDGGLAWNNRVNACTQFSILDPRVCEQGATHNVKLVWDRKAGEDPLLVREPLFSYGIGLRLNVFYTILRFDYAVPLSRPARSGMGDGIFSISFGPSF
ncbi:MAG: BamA/TamA family outer membrane protein [Gemmatimonadota bacterium]